MRAITLLRRQNTSDISNNRNLEARDTTQIFRLQLFLTQLLRLLIDRKIGRMKKLLYTSNSFSIEQVCFSNGQVDANGEDLDFIIDDVEALDLLPVWLKRFLSPRCFSNSSSSKSTNDGAQLDLLVARAFPEIFTVRSTEQEVHDTSFLIQKILLLSLTEIVELFQSSVVL